MQFLLRFIRGYLPKFYTSPSLLSSLTVGGLWFWVAISCDFTQIISLAYVPARASPSFNSSVKCKKPGHYTIIKQDVAVKIRQLRFQDSLQSQRKAPCPMLNFASWGLLRQFWA